MWESLKSLLRISKHNVNNIDNSLFTIKVLKDFDEKDLDKVIAKLKNKSIDGFILKRALSKAQTESLVKYFSSLVHNGEHFNSPSSFASCHLLTSSLQS